MKLLLAEDDLDLQNAVKTLLERSGYSVDAVDNGADAVDYTESAEYDGMILDWMMPEMDGIQALCEMRKKGIRVMTQSIREYSPFTPNMRGFESSPSQSRSISPSWMYRSYCITPK